ncbi:gluconokinase [uncultured Jannaschia sp.]|uniref:gluconokinase n=1 Tax=uncultured Jannaschia sp. TaxID=293347 RepID=UPI002602DA8B|nr:gluconokinase [uncultured Jannaschia sp.]
MALKILVMGVTATGKTTLGIELAQALRGRFVDGDDLHPRGNVRKMARGEPLTDRDRAPWLDRVGRTLAESDGITVIACSALKRAYRNRIRARAGFVTLVHLTGDRDTLERRLKARIGHYMPASLLDSQLATLEPPTRDEWPIVVEAIRPRRRLVGEVLDRLRGRRLH